VWAVADTAAWVAAQIAAWAAAPIDACTAASVEPGVAGSGVTAATALTACVMPAAASVLSAARVMRWRAVKPPKPQ